MDSLDQALFNFLIVCSSSDMVVTLEVIIKNYAL